MCCPQECPKKSGQISLEVPFFHTLDKIREACCCSVRVATVYLHARVCVCVVLTNPVKKTLSRTVVRKWLLSANVCMRVFVCFENS